VANLNIDSSITFKNPYTSVAVMVSMLRKKEEHAGKIFKISFKNKKTTVTRHK
jgi:hypothetical protein